MKSPLQGMTFLPETMALKLLTAATNAIKTWTNLLIRLMATTQIMNINPPKKKPGKTILTKSLHLKEDLFRETVA